MSACPACHTNCPGNVQFCATCGTSLAALGGASDDDPASRVGMVVGQYRLLEVLGKGGMGCVYRAEHTLLGRKVALKMLRPDRASNPSSVRRFFAEARAVNQ